VTIRLILLVFALACFVMAAAGVSSKVGLQPLGLAFLTAAMLF
jgi:hypothetical protein